VSPPVKQRIVKDRSECQRVAGKLSPLDIIRSQETHDVQLDRGVYQTNHNNQNYGKDAHERKYKSITLVPLFHPLNLLSWNTIIEILKDNTKHQEVKIPILDEMNLKWKFMNLQQKKHHNKCYKKRIDDFVTIPNNELTIHSCIDEHLDLDRYANVFNNDEHLYQHLLKIVSSSYTCFKAYVANHIFCFLDCTYGTKFKRFKGRPNNIPKKQLTVDTRNSILSREQHELLQKCKSYGDHVWNQVWDEWTIKEVEKQKKIFQKVKLKESIEKLSLRVGGNIG
jgi:hypothetical protein